ncbi:MAG: nucleotidyltransferase family protein [Promethearchaeota archaeon]
MKAVILCAGYGKRLRPYTNTIQKSMIPILGKPLLEYILNELIYAGFKDIVIVVGYRKEQVIEYFNNGDKWGIKIEYVKQKQLDGTGGAVLSCESTIKDSHFFLTWGDILVPYEIYKKVISLFREEKHDFILVANYTEDPYKGSALYCRDNFLINILEKPSKGKSQTNLNNCGIFILSTEIFETLKTLKPSKRGEIELTDALNFGILERKWKVRVIKMEKNQFRGDFGDIKVYEQLNKDSSWLKELNKPRL